MNPQRERWIQGYIQRTEGKNKEALKEFLLEQKVNGLSSATRVCYARAITKFLKAVGKNYDDVKKDDVLEFFANSDYSPSHTMQLKVLIKRFYKWVNGGDYPSSVKWIRTGRCRANSKIQIITRKDLKRLVDACHSFRDKVFLCILYDSGARISEILDLNIGDISFDSHGAKLHVKGKTGERNIRLIESAPLLRAWVYQHNKPHNPLAPLFYSNLGNRWSRSCVGGFFAHLKKRTNWEGRLSPHIFRHSRASELAYKLSEQALRQHFGWTKNSAMVERYLHRSEDRLDYELLKLYGESPLSEPQHSRTDYDSGHHEDNGFKI